VRSFVEVVDAILHFFEVGSEDGNDGEDIIVCHDEFSYNRAMYCGILHAVVIVTN
jgi:hypothetical protein